MFRVRNYMQLIISQELSSGKIHPWTFRFNLTVSNVEAKCFLLLLRILEIPGSSLGPETGFPAKYLARISN